MTSAPGQQPDGVGCYAPGCPRMPTRGRLCSWHYDKLGQALTDLAADMVSSHEPSLSGWRTGGASGGPLPSERDPVNFRLLDAQRQAPPVLRAWARWLCKMKPDLTRDGSPEGDRKLIVHELDWISGQPEIRDLWVQVRALWASLRGHLPVRRCTCVDPETGLHGPVWSDRGGGWCSWCATAWSGSELLKLRLPEEAA